MQLASIFTAFLAAPFLVIAAVIDTGMALEWEKGAGSPIVLMTFWVHLEGKDKIHGNFSFNPQCPGGTIPICCYYFQIDNDDYVLELKLANGIVINEHFCVTPGANVVVEMFRNGTSEQIWNGKGLLPIFGLKFIFTEDHDAKVSVPARCDSFSLYNKNASCHYQDDIFPKWRVCPVLYSNYNLPPLECDPCKETPPKPPDDLTNATVIIGVVVGVAAAVIVLIVIAVLCYKFWIRKRRERHEIHLATLHVRENNYEDFKSRDQWEIDRQCIEVKYDDKLGNGAFGFVYKGRLVGIDLSTRQASTLAEISILRTAHKSVAVKMLPVNIIGCVTYSDPNMLLMEYCSSGDLLKFLLDKKEKMESFQTSESEYSCVLSLKQQLMFAVQICCALEYLSQKGFVHRDVAARNILLDDNLACKLADFGLCKHVETAHDNYLSKGGQFPLKWMPPEAITDYQFSTKSDVWSFGAVFFEIMTLGGPLYPGWPVSEILTRLSAGERMDRPRECPDEMHDAISFLRNHGLFRYDLMMSCWEQTPEERPDFSLLRSRLCTSRRSSERQLLFAIRRRWNEAILQATTTC